VGNFDQDIHSRSWWLWPLVATTALSMDSMIETSDIGTYYIDLRELPLLRTGETLVVGLGRFI
jgi:hypothetical protein